jgi:hypothetical protein
VLSNGDTFSCPFDFLNQQGVMRWPNGDVYDGEFVNSLREGDGKRTFSNGDQYSGAWKDGRKDGFGYVMLARDRWNGPLVLPVEEVLVHSDRLYGFGGLAL